MNFVGLFQCSCDAVLCCPSAVVTLCCVIPVQLWRCRHVVGTYWSVSTVAWSIAADNTGTATSTRRRLGLCRPKWNMSGPRSLSPLLVCCVGLVATRIYRTVIRVVSSEISGEKFPEIYSNLSAGNLLITYANQLFPSPALQSEAV